MRGIGIGIIISTIILMVIPVAAFIDNPYSAMRGAVDFYIMFVFAPLALGVLLIYLSFRQKNDKGPR